MKTQGPYLVSKGMIWPLFQEEKNPTCPAEHIV